MRRRLRGLAAGLALALLLAATARVGARLPAEGSALAGAERVALPEPGLVRHLDLHFDGLAADYYWTEAVQYFGARRRAERRDYPQLAGLLNLTLDLDPDLTVAAGNGAFFLADQAPLAAGQPRQAVALLNKALARHPDDWRLDYDLGFIEALNLHDRQAAAQAFAAGAAVPGANPVLRVLAASYYSQVDQRPLAQALWQGVYDQSPDRLVRENALDHLQALRVKNDLDALRQLIARYREQKGAAPGSWRDLIASGALQGVPSDPQGHAYALVDGGEVAVSAATHIRSLGRP